MWDERVYDVFELVSFSFFFDKFLRGEGWSN